MSADLGDVQRIVLHGSPWQAALHLMVSFEGGAPCHFLHALLGRLSGALDPRPTVQCSVGFTRRGLERAGVPRNVMARLALKAPAFWAGAALRAGRHAGLGGRSAPERWSVAFATEALDLVISLHGSRSCEVEAAAAGIRGSAQAARMRITPLPWAEALKPPARFDEGAREEERRTGLAPQWVHFGYRDGLSRIGIVGWPSSLRSNDGLLPSSIHQPGEFVLGHVADSGADPWVAGPGMRVWPANVRRFFRNASFGVLQQVVQDVDAFETFVSAAAKRLSLAPGGETARDPTDQLKGKLCGRYPDGQPLAVPTQDPNADFDYTHDPYGFGCPFGSHVRRMNPRTHRPRGEAPAAPPAGAAHFSRARPLIRRGMPYGPAWVPLPDGAMPTKGPERGLLGHFFCASIEDQFEHLLAEWGDRVPLGSADGGGARDPLIGAHEHGDGPFEVPLPPPAEQPFKLRGLQPFVHTVGAAYLFYPSLGTLKGIADSELWREVENER